MIATLIDWAGRTPDAPAFIEPGRTITYGALFRGAQAGAAWLHGCGVRAGDTVALSLIPRPALTARQVSLFYATFYLGAPLLPLYPEAPLEQRTVLAARFGARWLIAGSRVTAPVSCTRLDPEAFDPEGDRAPAAAPYGYDPSRPLRYEFTSGTTGDAKVVVFTGAQYSTIVHSNVKCFDWTPGERLLPVAMWPGKVGMRGLVQIHAAGGALVNVPFPATLRQLRDVVTEFGVTAIRSVPWQVRQLLASEQPPGWHPLALRFFETAGALVAPQEVRAARAVLTPNFRVSYGSSESGVMAHLRPEDAYNAGPLLVPGMEGQAVDSAERPLAVGAVGRLRFRAPWLPAAYLGNAQASAERFGAGWYYPGDSGSIDAAGRVSVQGRTDDAITHGGLKILPREIEQVLEQHPDIAEAALAGVPDPLKGELPVAFVVLRRPVPFRAVVEFCAARIDRGRMPALFLTVATVPRNSEGKVMRSRLLEIYGEWQRRNPAARSGDAGEPAKAD